MSNTNYVSQSIANENVFTKRYLEKEGSTLELNNVCGINGKFFLMFHFVVDA